MFKKLIFTLLSFFYCTNIVSNYQLSNNSDKQLKTLLTIKNEINRLSLESQSKETLNNIIQIYLDSNKSINSYLRILQELKKALQTHKSSLMPSFVTSSIIGLVCGAGIYKLFTPSSSNFFEFVDEDEIKNGEKLCSELLQITGSNLFFAKRKKERSLIWFIEKSDKEKLNEILCNVNNSSWYNKLQQNAFVSQEKKEEIASTKKYFTDLYNFRENESIDQILNYHDTNKIDSIYGTSLMSLNHCFVDIWSKLRTLLDDAERYNNTYYFRKKSSLVIGATLFVLSYSLPIYRIYRINTVEKLIDKAIQDAELTLKN